MHTRYAPVRRSPPESIATLRAAPRLACIKPAASVHPEPGSNSSLYYIFYFEFLCSRPSFPILTKFDSGLSVCLPAYALPCISASLKYSVLSLLLRLQYLNELLHRPPSPRGLAASASGLLRLPSGSPLRRLSPLRHLGETGCKSTTFFYSTKIIFEKSFQQPPRITPQAFIRSRGGLSEGVDDTPI